MLLLALLTDAAGDSDAEDSDDDDSDAEDSDAVDSDAEQPDAENAPPETAEDRERLQEPREAMHGTAAQHYLKLLCVAAGPQMAMPLAAELENPEVDFGTAGRWGRLLLLAAARSPLHHDSATPAANRRHLPRAVRAGPARSALPWFESRRCACDPIAGRGGLGLAGLGLAHGVGTLEAERKCRAREGTPTPAKSAGQERRPSAPVACC